MKRIFFAFLLLICSFPISIIAGEFIHPAIISFETGILPAQAGKNSVLTVSADHYKHQQNSLEWVWSNRDASWSIKDEIPYHIKQNGDNGISTFVFWVYAAKPQEGDLKVEFLKDGRVCSYFIYHLNFSGWRGAWLAFDRDMQGKPEEGMNEMRITAVGSNAGELYFDHIILSADEDSRQQHAPPAVGVHPVATRSFGSLVIGLLDLLGMWCFAFRILDFRFWMRGGQYRCGHNGLDQKFLERELLPY